MDWKKEKISASELEKRQKAYMEEALAMMKRGGGVPEKPEEPASVTVSEISGIAESAVPAAVTEKNDEIAEKPDENGKTASDTEKEVPGPEDDDKSIDTSGDTAEEADEQETDTDDKYGVYTADEILNGEYGGDGLKKAAEILEEMTRNTEMMKKLARAEETDKEGDTVDFPEFSCPEEGEGERFRETAETEEDMSESGREE